MQTRICTWYRRYITLALIPIALFSVYASAGAVLGKQWLRHAIDNTSSGADGARLLDVNNDNRLDISTPWEEGGAVRAYLQPPAEKVRALWPTVNVGRLASPEDATFADLDGDGAFDIISSAEGDDRTVYLHWASANKDQYLNAAAWTTTPLPASKGPQWMFAAPLQIDGKYGTDFFAAGKNDAAQIGWFEAPENPRDADQWKWHPFQQVGWVMSIRTIDLDNDADLDLLYSDRKGGDRGVWWLENPGATHAASRWTRQYIGGKDYQVMFLDIADFDKNGGTDIFVATSGGGVLRISRAAGSAEWREQEIPLPENTGTGKSIAIGDIEGDGKSDLIVSCENAKDKFGVFRLSQNETGAWKAFDVSGLTGTKFDLVQRVDLDTDGDLDVVTCEERENLGVIWYENPK